MTRVELGRSHVRLDRQCRIQLHVPRSGRNQQHVGYVRSPKYSGGHDVVRRFGRVIDADHCNHRPLTFRRLEGCQRGGDFILPNLWRGRGGRVRRLR
jgi:hypothetical protein